MIFFFLKNTKLYNKKRLKKDKSIEIERNICWIFPLMIKLRSLSGRKPPDEIKVKDRLNESKVLTPDNESSVNITTVNIR